MYWVCVIRLSLSPHIVDAAGCAYFGSVGWNFKRNGYICIVNGKSTVISLLLCKWLINALRLVPTNSPIVSVLLLQFDIALFSLCKRACVVPCTGAAIPTFINNLFDPRELSWLCQATVLCSSPKIELCQFLTEFCMMADLLQSWHVYGEN